jgi:AraC-like DNA-binding protein
MRRCTPTSFLRHPIGGYVLGDSFIVWCHSPSLCGATHWGRRSIAETLEITRLYDFAKSKTLSAPFDVLLDYRHLDHIDGDAFVYFADYVRSQLSIWTPRMRQVAMLVPPKMVGFLLAGLLPVIGPALPIRFFGRPEDAVAALNRPDAGGVWDEVMRLVLQAREVPAVVRAVRDHLATRFATETLEETARSLGLTPRKLQRSLAEAKTGFSAELIASRVRAAAALLVETDLKIEAIARSVGCVSSSHLSLLFRRVHGITPARYRTVHASLSKSVSPSAMAKRKR